MPSEHSSGWPIDLVAGMLDFCSRGSVWEASGVSPQNLCFCTMLARTTSTVPALIWTTVVQSAEVRDYSSGADRVWMPDWDVL